LPRPLGSPKGTAGATAATTGKRAPDWCGQAKASLGGLEIRRCGFPRIETRARKSAAIHG
jgi:hypothetical protein